METTAVCRWCGHRFDAEPGQNPRCPCCNKIARPAAVGVAYIIASAAVIAVMFLRGGAVGAIIAGVASVILWLPGRKFLRGNRPFLLKVPMVAIALFVVCEMISDGLKAYKIGESINAAGNSTNQAPTRVSVAGAIVPSHPVHNVKYGFSIEIPGTWAVREGQGDLMESTEKVLKCFSEKPEPYKTASVAVRRLPAAAANASTADLEDFVRLDVEASTHSQSTLHVASVSKTELDGHPAFVVDMTRTEPDI